jgi:hypothetical protein
MATRTAATQINVFIRQPPIIGGRFSKSDAAKPEKFTDHPREPALRAGISKMVARPDSLSSFETFETGAIEIGYCRFDPSPIAEVGQARLRVRVPQDEV